MSFAQEMKDFAAGLKSGQDFWDKRAQSKYYQARADYYDRMGRPITSEQLAGQPGFTPGSGGGLDQPPSAGSSQSSVTPPATDVSGMTHNTVYNEFINSVKNGDPARKIAGIDNPYALAVIASTGKHESGFDPKNAAGDWPDGKNRAGGVMSWNGERLDKLRKANGGTNGTPAQQGLYFLTENPNITRALQNAKSLREAQTIINNAWGFLGYDKPDNKEAAGRFADSQGFFKIFSGGKGGNIEGGVGTPASGEVDTKEEKKGDAEDANAAPIDDGSDDGSGDQGDSSTTEDTGDQSNMVDTAGRTVAAIDRPVIPQSAEMQYSQYALNAPVANNTIGFTQPTQQPQPQEAQPKPTQVAAVSVPRSGVSKVADKLMEDEAYRQQALQQGRMFAAEGGVIPEFAGGGYVGDYPDPTDTLPDYLQPENQNPDYNEYYAATPVENPPVPGQRPAPPPPNNRAGAEAKPRGVLEILPSGEQVKKFIKLGAQEAYDALTKTDNPRATQPKPSGVGAQRDPTSGRQPTPPHSPTPTADERNQRRSWTTPVPQEVQQREQERVLGQSPQTPPDYDPMEGFRKILRMGAGDIENAIIPNPRATTPAPSGVGAQRDPTGGRQPARPYSPSPSAPVANPPVPADRPVQNPPVPQPRPAPPPAVAEQRGNDLTNAGGVDPTTGEPLPDLRPRPAAAAPAASQGNDLTNAGGVDPTTGEPLPDLKPRQAAPAPQQGAIPVPLDRPVENAPVPTRRPSQAKAAPHKAAPHKAAPHRQQQQIQQPIRYQPVAPPTPWQSESGRVYHQVAPSGYGRYVHVDPRTGRPIQGYRQASGGVIPPEGPALPEGDISWSWARARDEAPTDEQGNDLSNPGGFDPNTGEPLPDLRPRPRPADAVPVANPPVPYDRPVQNPPVPLQRPSATAGPVAHPPVPLRRPAPPAPQAGARAQAGPQRVINESDRVYHQVAASPYGRYEDVVNARARHAGPIQHAVYQQARGGVIPSDDDPQMLNARSESPRIYQGSTAEQVAQSRPANPVYADNAPAPAPAGPAPAQGGPQPAPPPPQVNYAGAQPGHADPRTVGVAQVGLHHGMSFLHHIFGFGDDQGAMPTPEQDAVQKAGVRHFMNGDGAATPQDNASIDATANIDPNQSDAAKVLDRLARMTQVYLANGKKKEAGAAAAQQMLYASQQFGRLGALAGASYAEYEKTGDPAALQHTLDFMSKAHEYVPDGATFGVYVDPQTHQITATHTDVDGNESHYAIKPSELPGIIEGIRDKSSYWQQVAAIADPAGARAAASRADVNRRYERTQEGVNKRFKENQAGITERYKQTREDRKSAAEDRKKAAADKVVDWSAVSPLVTAASQAQLAVDNAGGNPGDNPELERKRDEAASALLDAIPNAYTYKTKFLNETPGLPPMGTYNYIPPDQRGAAAPAAGDEGDGEEAPAAAPAAGKKSTMGKHPIDWSTGNVGPVDWSTGNIGNAPDTAKKPPPAPKGVPPDAHYDFGRKIWIQERDGHLYRVG